MNASRGFWPRAGRVGPTGAFASGWWPGGPAALSLDAGSLLRKDRPRAIDRYIDYFGASASEDHFEPASRGETGGGETPLSSPRHQRPAVGGLGRSSTR
jgi:hypothetical protein